LQTRRGPCGPCGAMAESAHKFFSRFGNVAGNLRNSITEFAADVLETAEELSQQVERTPDAPAAAPMPAPAPGQQQGDAMMTRLAALRSRIAAERARSGCARRGLLRFECRAWRRLPLTPLRGRRQERGKAAGGGARRGHGAQSGRCAPRSAHLARAHHRSRGVPAKHACAWPRSAARSRRRRGERRPAPGGSWRRGPAAWRPRRCAARGAARRGPGCPGRRAGRATGGRGERRRQL